MFTTFFTDMPVEDCAGAKTSDTERYGRFFHALRQRGVCLAPSKLEAGFISTARDMELVADTAAKVTAAPARM